MTTVADPMFAPPRPGVWFLDLTHFTRPATRFQAELFPEQFVRGFGESLRRYGSLLDHLDNAFINGFWYFCPRPVGASEEAVEHPPREVWEELARGHPEIRRRLETSATVFERKPWREDLALWDRERKPAAIRGHEELLAVDPANLGTDDLLIYLDRCRENQKQACYIHHRLNVPALLPVGDFLVHAREWTGRSGGELLGLLQGATPDPLGADEELARLVAAVEHDAVAAALLDAGGEPG